MRFSWTLIVLVAFLGFLELGRAENYVIRMPDVKPTRPDTYLCTGLKLPDHPIQVIGYKPLAKMDTAHHMLLYSCKSPGRSVPAWNCGEMGGGSGSPYPKGGTCASGAKLIYAWAMDAPALDLPPDVAFKIPAGDTLVLQVHYNDVHTFVDDGATDNSGIELISTTNRLPKSAAVFLAGTGGQVPRYQVTYLETACPIRAKKEMHPFAFRTHTHTHGRVVSGYRVRNKDWTEIGRGNPRRPQMFYNVSDVPEKLALRDGDYIAARCTMYNRHNRDVYIGGTAKDEMCNFYMMYWVHGDIANEDSSCWSGGYPFWDWRKINELDSDNTAPLKASVQPPLKEDEEEVVKDHPEAADASSVGTLPEDDPRFVLHDKEGGRFYMDQRTRAAFNLFDFEKK